MIIAGKISIAPTEIKHATLEYCQESEKYVVTIVLAEESPIKVHFLKLSDAQNALSQVDSAVEYALDHSLKLASASAGNEF